MADGRLIVDAFLTRTGVFVYRNPDGTERREFRPPEEVFHADALDSMKLAPVTNDHPPELIDSTTARQFAVGAVGEAVRRDGDRVAASLVVFDADTIAEMDAGKLQTSCGYECDIEETSGTSPNGERFDVIQRNIRGNHVAIVQTGRAGAEIAVRMDASYQVEDAELTAQKGSLGQVVADEKTPCYDGNNMADEKTKDLLIQSQADRLVATDKRADEAEAKVADLEKQVAGEKSRADKAEADRDSAKERADTAEDPKKLRDAIKARVALETAAVKVLGPEFKFDELDDRAVRVAALKKCGVEITKERSDDYVKARFDGAIENYDASDGTILQIGHAAGGAQPRSDVESARQKMIQRQRDAWKPKEMN